MSEGKEASDQLINRDHGRAYWESVDGDANGMLGGVPTWEGFSSISRIDLQGSRTFLARLGIGTKNDRRAISTALEGGAGIGRVTEGLLTRVSEHVDVIEPISKFANRLKGKERVRNIFVVGLEEWRPSVDLSYDLVWVQWCAGHVTDEQLVIFLKLATTVLTPKTGLIVLKENLSTSDVDLFDETDSSVTRQDSSFCSVFERAGLTVVKTELQRGLPEHPTRRLFPVKMYALRPRE